MLPASRRLSREEARVVFTRGRVVARPHVAFRFLKNEHGPKFLVSVGARISARATERNAVKRRLRAAVQGALGRSAPISVSGVVSSTKKTREASTAELTAELIDIFETALR